MQVLPDEWISRLFTRLQAIYGNRVSTMWGAADPQEVRTVWAERLGPFAQDIGPALEAMERSYRDYPPTLPQFTELCRDARKRRIGTTLRLNAPLTPMPDKIRQQLEAFKIGHVTKQ